LSPSSDEREWDGGAYHRLSDPQTAWGQKVLARLPLAGDETVLDAGCGTGRLTALILERLPRGRVIAVDQSADMLRQARATLAGFGDRVTFLHADIAALELTEAADAIFSTATFHWILDHARLFATLHAALRPGGRLVAQCGAKDNLASFLRIVHAAMAEKPFATYLGGRADPWEYADAATTAARLTAAGFVDVETSEEPATTPFDAAADMRAFVSTCILRLHLERLPEGLREPFLDAIMHRTPLILDYRRLNLAGRKILTGTSS
jgi:trans-aconitate 2-methyltransferase